MSYFTSRFGNLDLSPDQNVVPAKLCHSPMGELATLSPSITRNCLKQLLHRLPVPKQPVLGMLMGDPFWVTNFFSLFIVPHIEFKSTWSV